VPDGAGTGGPPSPRRRATALSYAGDGAPRITAAGRGLVAERILAEAKAAGVPVREDAVLAGALEALDLGAEVPEALWTAVAEALAWAYRVDQREAARRRR
jgi:flagellar biosynthesis protein